MLQVSKERAQPPKEEQGFKKHGEGARKEEQPLKESTRGNGRLRRPLEEKRRQDDDPREADRKQSREEIWTGADRGRNREETLRRAFKECHQEDNWREEVQEGSQGYNQTKLDTFRRREDDRRGDCGGHSQEDDRRGGHRERRREDERRGGHRERRREDDRRGGHRERRREDDPRRGYEGRSQEDDRRGGYGDRSREDDRRGGHGDRSQEDDRRGGYGGRSRKDDRRRGYVGRSREDDRRRGYGGRSREDDWRERGPSQEGEQSRTERERRLAEQLAEQLEEAARERRRLVERCRELEGQTHRAEKDLDKPSRQGREGSHHERKKESKKRRRSRSKSEQTMLGEQEGQLREKRRMDSSEGQGGPSEGTSGLPDANKQPASSVPKTGKRRESAQEWEELMAKGRRVLEKNAEYLRQVGAGKSRPPSWEGLGSEAPEEKERLKRLQIPMVGRIPRLLLHELGVQQLTHQDILTAIKRTSESNTRFLVGLSCCGKTRTIMDRLAEEISIFFTMGREKNFATGDFEYMVEQPGRAIQKARKKHAEKEGK
jgi:hypothetical protein